MVQPLLLPAFHSPNDVSQITQRHLPAKRISKSSFVVALTLKFSPWIFRAAENFFTSLCLAHGGLGTLTEPLSLLLAWLIRERRASLVMLLVSIRTQSSQGCTLGGFFPNISPTLHCSDLFPSQRVGLTQHRLHLEIPCLKHAHL